MPSVLTEQDCYAGTPVSAFSVGLSWALGCDVLDRVLALALFMPGSEISNPICLLQS